MRFRMGYQCFVGTTDGTTETYILPEASKYMAFRSRLWAPLLFTLSKLLYFYSDPIYSSNLHNPYVETPHWASLQDIVER